MRYINYIKQYINGNKKLKSINKIVLTAVIGTVVGAVLNPVVSNIYNEARNVINKPLKYEVLEVKLANKDNFRYKNYPYSIIANGKSSSLYVPVLNISLDLKQGKILSPNYIYIMPLKEEAGEVERLEFKIENNNRGKIPIALNQFDEKTYSELYLALKGKQGYVVKLLLLKNSELPIYTHIDMVEGETENTWSLSLKAVHPKIKRESLNVQVYSKEDLDNLNLENNTLTTSEVYSHKEEYRQNINKIEQELNL